MSFGIISQILRSKIELKTTKKPCYQYALAIASFVALGSLLTVVIFLIPWFKGQWYHKGQIIIKSQNLTMVPDLKVRSYPYE